MTWLLRLLGIEEAPAREPGLLPPIQQFSCPTDGGWCNDLMCEGGPSTCLMARTRPYAPASSTGTPVEWRSTIFRGAGCE